MSGEKQNLNTKDNLTTTVQKNDIEVEKNLDDKSNIINLNKLKQRQNVSQNNVQILNNDKVITENDNGGYDKDKWGVLDVNQWQYDKNYKLIGYTGDRTHIIVPNLIDFVNDKKIDASYLKTKKEISIEKALLQSLGRGAETIALSKTNQTTDNHVYDDKNTKVKAANNDVAGLFNNVQNPYPYTVTAVDFTNLDLTGVFSINWMFASDKLTEVGDLSKWNTSDIWDMSNMFYNARSLKDVGNLDKWDTSSVMDMNHMFYGTESLQNIGDLSNWNTSNVKSMENMFGDAKKLKKIGDLSRWNVSHVTKMRSLFQNTSSLEELGDLSQWKLDNVTDMSFMFAAASSLKDVGNLSKWAKHLGKISNVAYMFSSMKSMKNVNICGWNLSALSTRWSEYGVDGMFFNNPNLTVIANDIKIPAESLPETMFSPHMAVITNNSQLLANEQWKDELKIDKESQERNIFYNSKGSVDAIKVITEYNNKFIKEYEADHPKTKLKYIGDPNNPIELANAIFISEKDKDKDDTSDNSDNVIHDNNHEQDKTNNENKPSNDNKTVISDQKKKSNRLHKKVVGHIVSVKKNNIIHQRNGKVNSISSDLQKTNILPATGVKSNKALTGVALSLIGFALLFGFRGKKRN